jgi:hypothetical protein
VENSRWRSQSRLVLDQRPVFGDHGAGQVTDPFFQGAAVPSADDHQLVQRIFGQHTQERKQFLVRPGLLRIRVEIDQSAVIVQKQEPFLATGVIGNYFLS